MGSTAFSGLMRSCGFVSVLASCGGEPPAGPSSTASSEGGATWQEPSTSTTDATSSGSVPDESTGRAVGTTGGIETCPVEFGSLSLVSTLPFGGVVRLDRADGGRMVLGPEGGALLVGAESREAVQLVEEPPGGRMDVGALRGGATRNDVLYLGGDGGFSVFADVEDGGGTLHEGTVSASVYSTLADLNGDGRDDVILQARSYGRIEAWDLAIGGEPELLAEFETEAGLPVVGAARRFQSFPALALYANDEVHGMRLEATTLVEDFAFESIGVYAVEGLEPLEGEDRRLLVSSFFQQGASGANSIAISTRQLETQTWMHARADLDLDLSVLLTPQTGDLDGDGVADVVLVARQKGLTYLVGLCSRDGQLRECASRQIEGGAVGLVVASNGLATEMFIARGDEGLWEVSVEGLCG